MGDVIGFMLMGSVTGLSVGFGIGSLIASFLNRYQSLDPEDPPMLHRFAAYCSSMLRWRATIVVDALSTAVRAHVLFPARQLLHAFSAGVQERVHGAWAYLLLMVASSPVASKFAVLGAGFPSVARRVEQVRLLGALHDAVCGPRRAWWEQFSDAVSRGRRWPSPREPVWTLAPPLAV